MKAMWIYLRVIIVLFLFSVFAATEIKTDVPDEKTCNSNMSPYHFTTSYGPKIICAYISPERINWDDAKFRCNLLFAQLTQRIYFKSSLRIDLLNKGIDTIWMGIRRRNSFFVTEYPSKLFREAEPFSHDYWGYHWSAEEPGLNDCVALDISNGSLQTRSCGDILPFVCEEDGKDISAVYKNLACPDGWNISFGLSSSGRTCTSAHKARMHQKAEDFCAKNDGRLASFEEYQVLMNTNVHSLINAEDFWIKKKGLKLCEVTRNINGHLSKTLTKSCKLKYPFACVKHYKIPSISVHLSPKLIQPLQSDSKDTVDLLTCDLETAASELKTESLRFQWYKNSLPIPVNSYVMRLSFIGDVLKRDPYIYNTASRQGHYYCGVQIPGLNEMYFSPKMNFFYSDVATYIVEIRGMKQTYDLDYSHQHFFDYMDDFHEASMSDVLKKLKIRYPKAEWDFINKSISNGEVIMKIVVYIYKTGVEDFDERMACEDLKDAFEELHSVPVFMEKMLVYINCEDFPVTNEYVKVIKSLQNIEAKLNRMETIQENILKKLQACEKSKNVESERNNYYLDVTQFLKIVEDLKRLESSVLHKAPGLGNSVNERERNEFEDTFYTLTREEVFGKSNKKSRPEGTISQSKPRHFIEEENENYNRHSENDWQKISSKEIVFWKDL